MLTNKPRSFHVYMPISEAERQTDQQLERMFKGSAIDTRTNLAIMKAQGMEVIPAAGCNNQDAKGYCLGHDVETTSQIGGAA